MNDLDALPLAGNDQSDMEHRLGCAAAEKDQVAGAGFFKAFGPALPGLLPRAGRQAYVEALHHVAGESGTIETGGRIFSCRGISRAFVLLGVRRDVAAQAHLFGAFGGSGFGGKVADEIASGDQQDGNSRRQ